VFATTRARTLTEQDSTNLARALHHYSAALDQPQPPGYPLVVLVAHAFTWTGSIVGAYEAVAAIATVGAVATTYLLGKEMFGHRAGIVAGLIVCATPLVLYYGDLVSVYPTEMLLVPLVALLAFRVATRRDRTSAVLLLPVLAVTGGFRPTALLLMMPAAVVGIVLGRPRWLDVTAGASVGVLILAAWAIPMIQKSGGWRAYEDASRSLYHRQFSQTSFFYGASLHQVAFNGACALGATVMVAVPAAVVVVVGYRGPKSSASMSKPALWILSAWIVPYWIMYFGIQLGKPGYVLAYLPVFAVLGGGLVAASSRVVLLSTGVFVVALLGFLVLPQWPFPWRLDAFFPTANGVHLQDEEALGLRRVASTCPRSTCTIVSLPSSRRFWYHDAASLGAWYAPESRVIESGDVRADRSSLAEVFWVGTTVPESLARLATYVGSAGTWSIYESSPAVTESIVQRAFG